MSKQICDAKFPWCTNREKKRELYKLRLNDLSPTQFAVGRAEVEVRAAGLRMKYEKGPDKLHD